MTADRIAADDLDALTGAALFGCLDWREEREPVASPLEGEAGPLDPGGEIGEDGGMRGTTVRVAVLVVSVAVLGASAKQQPPPSSGGYTNFSNPSSTGGGCKKGCRCGRSCIDCKKTCRGGSTYRKRKR